MDFASTWNSLEVAKLVLAGLTPLAITVLGFWFNLSLRKAEWDRDREHQERQAEKEREERERLEAPHIELDIGCSFMGPSYKQFVAQFTLTAHNKGISIHRFRSIILRVRAIKPDQKLKLLEGHEPRLEFPEEVFEAELIPKNWNFIFVQPNIKQQITFISPIALDYKYIIVNTTFYYDEYTPHNLEKAFELPTVENP